MQIWVVLFGATELEDTHWARAGKHILLLVQFIVQALSEGGRGRPLSSHTK